MDSDSSAKSESQRHERVNRSNGNGAGLIPASTAAQDRYDKRLNSNATEQSRLLPNGSANGEESIIGSNDGGQDGNIWSGDADFEGLSWRQRPSVYWLLPPFFLYSLAFGGIIVPRLNLILSLVCRSYFSDRSNLDPNFTFAPIILLGDNPECRRNADVQELATKFNLYLTLISGILAAIASPKLGSLSDRYGRKSLICITSIGLLFSEIVTILAASYPVQMHYSWLALGAVFDGICGSFIAGMALTHSYAADCSPPAKRAVAFGYLHACLFGGIALGPIFAAYLTSFTGNILTVFYTALGCHVLFVLFILFVIPESLSSKRQLAARERHRSETEHLSPDAVFRALRFANILAPLKILYPTGPGTSTQLRMNLLLLSSVDTIIFGVGSGVMVVIIYYSEFMFGWGDFETQIFMSIANISRVSTLVIVLPLLNYLVRTRRKNRLRRESGIDPIERNSGSDNLDLYTIRISLVIEMIGFAGYAASRTGGFFLVSAVLASLGGMMSPILHSALTKHVPNDRTGQLLGATGLLHALSRIISPTIFNLLYAATIKTFPQTVFVLVSACFGVAFVISWFVKPHVYLEEPDSANVTTHDQDYEDDGVERAIEEEIARI